MATARAGRVSSAHRVVMSRRECEMCRCDAVTPPDDVAKTGGGGEMKRVCINRHEGFINCLFMDWSTRKVGFKELWTLKWYRSFKTANAWTRAGGVKPSDWPQWMRAFRDY